MILAQLLAADGLVVGSCHWCGRAYAVDLDHDGKPNVSKRKYCCRRCRAVAALHRRLPRRRHARAWATLTELHQIERAGQIPLPGQDPLPDVPTYEEQTA